MSYLYFDIAGLLLMALSTALQHRSLRQGGVPRPRFSLAVCLLFFVLFSVTIAMVIAWDDASSWVSCVSIGACFVLACKTRGEAVHAAVLIVLKANPDGVYRLDLRRSSRVAPGSPYPLLFRLEKQGVVRSWWGERPADGGPRRRYRYYALADEAAGQS